MKVHGANFVLNPLKRWQTNKTIAAIRFYKKTGEGKLRYSSGLCWQKTDTVDEDRKSQAWTSHKYNENPANALWINSTRHSSAHVLHKGMQRLLLAHLKPSPGWIHPAPSAFKCSSHLSGPLLSSLQFTDVFPLLGAQYPRCSWMSAVVWLLCLLAVLFMQDGMLPAFPASSCLACAHQDLQVLFSRAASQPVSPQPLFLQFLQLQEEDFASVLPELLKTLAGPFLQPV